MGSKKGSGLGCYWSESFHVTWLDEYKVELWSYLYMKNGSRVLELMLVYQHWNGGPRLVLLPLSMRRWPQVRGIRVEKRARTLEVVCQIMGKQTWLFITIHTYIHYQNCRRLYALQNLRSNTSNKVSKLLLHKFRQEWIWIFNGWGFCSS